MTNCDIDAVIAFADAHAAADGSIRAGRSPSSSSYAEEVAADRAPDDETVSSDFELEPDVEALVEDDDAGDPDDTRHYLRDPNNLAENARDADEREQDDVLDLDQTELEELGLTLDDPHQPEPE